MTTPSLETDRPSGPRSRKGERTRARIVDAAKLVFEETGFLDARISDIVERAELSHGSFYHYFDSKEDVFLEVAAAQEVRFSRDSILESGLLDEATGATMGDRLRTSLRLFLQEYRAEARIMGVIEQVSRYHEPVRAIRQARTQAYLRQAEEAISELQRLGLADPELDPAIVASALTSMITRFSEMWLAQGMLDCDFDHGVEQLARLSTNALRLREP
ncbi:TetR/AcrR family transcriptional regulator [Aquihabitans sp. McL0605]|uniref:TetR/AcrR family transcriptional regulator n=1 Tax=Aquihabitans sp. McL0605 TaxID=3415671 RepID=UPI003CF7E23A